jgi:hypothetical protein
VGIQPSLVDLARLSRADAKPVKNSAMLLAPIPGNSLSHDSVQNSDLCRVERPLWVEFPHSGARAGRSGIGAQPLSRPSGGLPLYVDVRVFGLGVGAMQT